MCASYGLGGGPLDDDEKIGIAPLDERLARAHLNEWLKQRDGRAAITGRIARNLNPVIHELDEGRALDLAWWSIRRPRGNKTAFNSRDDSLLRYWQKPFQDRALLPASWYVEKGKRFGLTGGDVFAIAAILSTFVDDEGQEHLAYSMVTRAAIGEAAVTHDRMPLVLPRELHDDWLDPERPGDAELVSEVQHASTEISEAMTAGGERGDKAALF